MTDTQKSDKWFEVTQNFKQESLPVGGQVAYWLRRSPRRLLHSMSYYKFAAKMIGISKKVLDIGCGEGWGTFLLGKECGFAVGLDLDQDAVISAADQFDSDSMAFIHADFLKPDQTDKICEDANLNEKYDAVVSFDVIEHILPENSSVFFKNVCQHLTHDGVVVLGTPNIESQKYASKISRAGHINCYSGQRLETEMRKWFSHVFMFGANDEVVHTGFLPMAHYLIAVGCQKKDLSKG